MLNALTAAKRHHGQTWGNCPYHVHLEAVNRVCLRVNSHLGSPISLVDRLNAAYMHDVVEDTDTSLEEIPESIRGSIILVSRNLSQPEGTTYHEYIRIIADSGDLLAIMVKFSDAITNLVLCEITGNALAARYRRSTHTLAQALFRDQSGPDQRDLKAIVISILEKRNAVEA